MANLLAAEFHRIRRDPVSWLLAAAALISGLVFGFSGRYDDVFVFPIFIVQAVFISLSLGREYNDGTLRNKIIAGKTKTAIFLSKLLVSLAASLVFTVLFLLPFIPLAHRALSGIPGEALLWMSLVFFLLNLVWAALFTLVSSLISAKGVAGILNLILIFALIACSYELARMLRQPAELDWENSAPVPLSQEELEQLKAGSFQKPFSQGFDENGEVSYYTYSVTEGTIPNPKYIREPWSGLLRGLHAALPSGPINDVMGCLGRGYHDIWEETDAPPLERYPLYSLAGLLLLSALGLVTFRKKEIR